MSIKRATVIAKMRKAFKLGVSQTRFLADMKAAGLSYRHTNMIADWHDANKVAYQEGRMRFIRKGYAPADRIAELKEWAMSKEYMYKVKTKSRLHPDEPITERFVNIMSDVPLTVREVQAQVEERWGEWEKYAPEELVSLQVWTAVHRVAL